ncbi:MAG: CopG family transcriptional regulator [Candidatus Rokubacteria bacterium]|nr:CopG family transcriptional regulator [Candidatus Rokubacteria bacterium]
MRAVQKSIRIPEEIVRLVEDLARMSGRDFTATINELLDEALKMRRFPGIVLADGPAGRRARLAGTGLDVWEVIATYRSVDRDTVRLHKALPWVPEPALRAALAYFAAYPAEIDQRIAASERWTMEELKARHPALMSGHE